MLLGDYQNALASHKQCVDLVRTQLNDPLQEAREIGNVGAVYLAIGDFDKAVECHSEHLKLAESLNNKVEAARAYSNLGSSHHYKRNFEQVSVSRVWAPPRPSHGDPMWNGYPNLMRPHRGRIDF